MVEVINSYGSPIKAGEKFGWKLSYNMKDMVSMLIEAKRSLHGSV